MNRLGWAILALIILVAVVFALLVRGGRSPAPEPQAPGKRAALIVPVAGVPASQLVDSFSDPRPGGRQHEAIDILAAAGTPVRAAAAGRIDKLFDSRLGGHTVYIRSPDGGTEYYYAHLDAYAPGLAEGAKVEQGQIIATVGSTGDADARAPHLHFEVHRMSPGEPWQKGRPIDPYPQLVGTPPAG